LISDIEMADTDADKLIKQVRAQGDDEVRSMPAIALTAYGRPQDRTRSMMAGYNAHVEKPLVAKDIVTVVKCMTGRLGKS